MWKIPCEAAHRRRDSGAWGIARALGFGQHERLMVSCHLLPFAGDENAAAKMSSSGGALFGHRNFIISSASSRKILKILISNIRQKTSRRVSFRPINSEFAGPLFLMMACGGVQTYAKTQISY
jgi:hypothetical protein